MKKVTLEEIVDGMKVGKDVIDEDGKLLVGEGTELNRKIVERLKKDGIKSIFILEKGDKIPEKIEDKSVGLSFLENLKAKNIKVLSKTESAEIKEDKKIKEDKEKKPVIIIKKVNDHEKINQNNSQNNQISIEELNEFLKLTKEYLKTMVLNIKDKGTLIPFNLSEDVLKIFNNLLVKKEVLINLKNMKQHNEYLYEHALYVSLVSIVAGEFFGYQKIILFSIGLGGLFLDSGMVYVPKEILEKKAVLKPDEKEIVKGHVIKSHELLSSVSQTTDIAKEIVLNHHEKIDGTGYPNMKRGEEISEYAKLVTIIDVYHALISERPYHAPKTGKEAFYTIFMYKGKQFDDKILAEIIKRAGVK